MWDPEKKDLLDDIDGFNSPQPADKTKRFFNYLIDSIAWYLLLSVVLVILQQFSPETIFKIQTSQFTSFMLITVVIIFYYFLSEKFFRGKTLGKLITRTRAVCLDGTLLGDKEAFMRSLIRLVPFEAISILFGEPWHDNWTNTTVVQE